MEYKNQGRALDRKKFFADPVLISMIGVLLVFLALFILYPLLMVLLDSLVSDGKVTIGVFKRILSMSRFRTAFTNTLTLGFITGLISTAVGLCKIKDKGSHGAFQAGLNAASRFPAFRSFPFDDYAFRTKRNHHPNIASYQ